VLQRDLSETADIVCRVNWNVNIGCMDVQ